MERTPCPPAALKQSVGAAVGLENIDPASPWPEITFGDPRSMKIENQQNGKYTLRWRLPDGRERQISTAADSLSEAKRLFEKSGLQQMAMMAEVARLNTKMVRALDPTAPTTIQQAVDRYLAHQATACSAITTRTRTRQLRQWIKISGARTLLDFTARNIGAYVNDPSQIWRLSVRREQLKTLRTFGEFLRHSGWLDSSPARLVKVDARNLKAEYKLPRLKRAFTEEEMDRLLDLTHPVRGGWPRARYGPKILELPLRFYHFAFAMGRWTGLRIGDICTMEWDAFSEDLGTVRVMTRKTGRMIQLTIHPRLQRAILDATSGMQRTGFLFPDLRNRYLHAPNESSIRSWQAQLFKRAEIAPGATFHSFRYAYIAECQRQGIPIEHIAVNVGHSTPGQTQGYLDRLLTHGSPDAPCATSADASPPAT